MLAVIAFVCLGAAAPLDESAEPLRVWLDGHKGALDVSGDAPVLRFNALVHSRLPVAVEAVEVGVLFARDGESLTAEPGPLYDDERAEDTREVGAVRSWLPVRLASGGEATVLVESTLSPNDPEPVSWLTHVLGYRLAEVNVPLLRELVGSDVFADEVAVVETMALAADPARKRAVRRRWGGDAALVAAFAELAGAPVPAGADVQVAIERVMAIRALGVLGGDAARSTLTALRKDDRQAALREPLMVMSIARLRGSPLEAPMAHALPPGVRRISDVVAAALDDVDGWAEPVVESAVDPAPAEAGEPGARPLWVVALVAVALVLVLLVFVVVRLRRRQ